MSVAEAGYGKRTEAARRTGIPFAYI